MQELIIKTHDFELAKKGLKNFSKKKTEELEIDLVETDGGFLGLGNHKVTGSELNNRLSVIQQHLIDLNDTNNKTIKEFGQVYNALEALDKDYIQAILASIKATEKTSESIKITQEQIKKIVEDQKKTLEVLKKFKQKLDSYNHLEDIDRIWLDCQQWYNEIEKLTNSINNAMAIGHSNTQKSEELETLITSSKSELDSLATKLEDLNNTVLSNKDSFDTSISNIIEENKQLANSLDIVSSIGRSNTQKSEELETLITSSKSELDSLATKLEDLNNTVLSNKDSFDTSISNIIEENDIVIKDLTKKLKYAYILAGGTLGLSIVELILILWKVL